MGAFGADLLTRSVTPAFAHREGVDNAGRLIRFELSVFTLGHQSMEFD
jgi:hypothetical protein